MNMPEKVLMSPPAYYRITEENENDNPSMSISNQPYLPRAWKQWTSIRNLYEKFGLRVFEVTPHPNLPDMIFTANGAWGKGRISGEYVLSNFCNEGRKPEKEHFKKALENLGYTTLELPEKLNFEGQGDVVTLLDVIIIAYGFRSSKDTANYIRRLLRIFYPFLELHIVASKFYHLDTCFMSLRGTDKEGIIFYPGAFSPDSVKKINKLVIKNKFPVSRKLAECFVCNSVFINDEFLLNVPFDNYSDESFELSESGVPLKHKLDVRYLEIIRNEPEYKRLIEFIWSLGYKIVPVYTSEFTKSGAGVRCLSLFL